MLFCLAFKTRWGLRVRPSLVRVLVLSLLGGRVGGSPSGHTGKPLAVTPYCLHRPSGAAPGWPGRLFPGADQEERGEGETVAQGVLGDQSEQGWGGGRCTGALEPRSQLGSQDRVCRSQARARASGGEGRVLAVGGG